MPDSLRLWKPPSKIYKPVLRAYILAYLSTTSPQLLALLFRVIAGQKNAASAWARAKSSLRRAASIENLPAGAAVLIGGSTILPRLFADLVEALRTGVDGKRSARRLEHDPVVRFLTAFAASICAFRVLNATPSKPLSDDELQQGHVEDTPLSPIITSEIARDDTRFDATSVPPPLGGKTMLLSIFGFVHAITVLGSIALERYRGPQAARRSPSTPSFAAKAIPPTAFITSCYVIMWAWFYSPDRLPRDYNRWITRAADLDPRLTEALRLCRYGQFAYGKNTGIAPLLGSFARDMGYPEVWGDPERTVPLPCELYHSGAGKNCEWHAFTRFARGWLFAMRMYMPLNLLVLFRRKSAKEVIPLSFLSAARSSAFLSAFVAFFYYGVCLARTRIGPRILGTSIPARQMLDGGICVGVGCAACGWSILIERASRRKEMALFVAPRALGALLPRRYDLKHMWREEVAFALSAATILTAADASPSSIKGVFGRVIRQVYA